MSRSTADGDPIPPPAGIPQPSEDSAETLLPAPSKSRALRRTVGFAFGILLLLAAAWVIYSQRTQMQQAWTSARHASPWLLFLVFLLPLANWFLISISFWILMRRHGRIGLVEMTAAIGGAWLLNYLPLRAGMFGRVAYHKAVNQISVKDSIRVMVLNLAIGGIAVLSLLILAVGMGSSTAPSQWAIVLTLPVLITAAAIIITVRAAGPWHLPAVFLLRYLDMLVWIARYAVVFAIVGFPIGLSGAVAVAAACQLAMVVPFIGNGLGLREWAVGLTAAALPASLISTSGDLSTAAGLAADLANRAAEVIVALIVGQLSLVYIGRRLRAARA